MKDVLYKVVAQVKVFNELSVLGTTEHIIIISEKIPNSKDKEKGEKVNSVL